MKILPTEINLGFLMNVMVLMIIALCGSFALATGDSGTTGAIALTAPMYALMAIGGLISSHLYQR